ncbi:unnamed protein product, partial [marine sediment metagenome]
TIPEDERLRQYGEGLPDHRLAENWEILKDSVKMWRDRRFLPENVRRIKE